MACITSVHGNSYYDDELQFRMEDLIVDDRESKTLDQGMRKTVLTSGDVERANQTALGILGHLTAARNLLEGAKERSTTPPVKQIRTEIELDDSEHDGRSVQREVVDISRYHFSCIQDEKEAKFLRIMNPSPRNPPVKSVDTEDLLNGTSISSWQMIPPSTPEPCQEVAKPKPFTVRTKSPAYICTMGTSLSVSEASYKIRDLLSQEPPKVEEAKRVFLALEDESFNKTPLFNLDFVALSEFVSMDEKRLIEILIHYIENGMNKAVAKNIFMYLYNYNTCFKSLFSNYRITSFDKLRKFKKENQDVLLSEIKGILRNKSFIGGGNEDVLKQCILSLIKLTEDTEDHILKEEDLTEREDLERILIEYDKDMFFNILNKRKYDEFNPIKFLELTVGECNFETDYVEPIIMMHNYHRSILFDLQGDDVAVERAMETYKEMKEFYNLHESKFLKIELFSYSGFNQIKEWNRNIHEKISDILYHYETSILADLNSMHKEVRDRAEATHQAMMKFFNFHKGKYPEGSFELEIMQETIDYVNKEIAKHKEDIRGLSPISTGSPATNSPLETTPSSQETTPFEDFLLSGDDGFDDSGAIPPGFSSVRINTDALCEGQ